MITCSLLRSRRVFQLPGLPREVNFFWREPVFAVLRPFPVVLPPREIDAARLFPPPCSYLKTEAADYEAERVVSYPPWAKQRAADSACQSSLPPLAPDPRTGGEEPWA